MLFWIKSFLYSSSSFSSRSSSYDLLVPAPLLLPPLDSGSPSLLSAGVSYFFAATKSCINLSIRNYTSTFLLTNPSPSDPLNRSTSSYCSVSDPPIPLPFSAATFSLISYSTSSSPLFGGESEVLPFSAWLLSIVVISLDKISFWALSSISLTSVLVFFSCGISITSPFLSSMWR